MARPLRLQLAGEFFHVLTRGNARQPIFLNDVDRDNYLLQVTRYLALNPVRAGVVSTAEAWPWSHHRAMAGIAPLAPYLTCDEILKCFDAHSRTAAQGAYRRFVDASREDDESVRIAIERGGILGGQALLTRVAPDLDPFSTALEIPQRERFAHRPALERLFDAVEGRDERNRRIHEAYDTHRYSIGQIARHLGVGRSTISRALPRPARSTVPEK